MWTWTPVNLCVYIWTRGQIQTTWSKPSVSKPMATPKAAIKKHQPLQDGAVSDFQLFSTDLQSSDKFILGPWLMSWLARHRWQQARRSGCSRCTFCSTYSSTRVQHVPQKTATGGLPHSLHILQAAGAAANMSDSDNKYRLHTHTHTTR